MAHLPWSVPEDALEVLLGKICAINGWRRGRIIDVEAIGFGLGDWHVARASGNRLGVSEMMRNVEAQVGGKPTPAAIISAYAVSDYLWVPA